MAGTSATGEDISLTRRIFELVGKNWLVDEKLMDAVRELIWTGSYGTTTIDHICERAGVKKGSFYYFFNSKSDLAVTAIDAEWLHRRPELDALRAKGDQDRPL